MKAKERALNVLTVHIPAAVVIGLAIFAFFSVILAILVRKYRKARSVS